MDPAQLASFRAAMAAAWDPQLPPWRLSADVTPRELARRQRSFIWRHDPGGTWRRAARHALGFHLLSALRTVLGPASLTAASRNALAGLIAAMPGKRRAIALANLQRAFPDATDAWRRRTWRRFVGMAVHTLQEVMALESRPPRDYLQHVELHGEDHLRTATADGRGVLTITAHFAAFPLVFARLVAGGWPVAVMVKRQRDPVFEQWWMKLRDRTGVISIPDLPPRQSVRSMMRWLHAGGVMCVAGDQRAPGSAPLIPFFGHDVHTYTQPVRLALKTGAAILPTFMYPPDHRGQQTMRILEPLRPPAAGVPEAEAVNQILRQFHAVLEDQVRAHPHAWWWVHNRFKRWDVAPPGPETSAD